MAWTPEQREKAAEARQRKIQERQERQEAAGIPDSRPPIAPEGTFPESSILDCHVGGVLVGDLPCEVQGRILYQQTDEGIEEFNAGKVESAARVTQDQYSKTLEHRRDAVKDQGMEPWQAPDPLKEVADAHTPEGMKAKFLSPARVAKDGTRGYEVVKDGRGDPVRVRDMVLGVMPESKVEQRNAFYRSKANQAISEIQKRHREEGGSTAVGEISTR